MTTDTMKPIVPQMHAESGFDDGDSAAPLRVSGFICLLLGLVSFFCVFGKPLLVLPIAAIVAGMFALRRFSGPTPLGMRPARIGIVLAVGFGACGLFLPWFKSMTLGSQAEKFARDYMEVIARREDYVAMELLKDHVNRFPPTMNLEEHYALSDAAKQSLEEFRSDTINDTIARRGPNAEWVLERPVKVYYSYKRQHAEVIFEDPSGKMKTKIRVFLEYRIDTEGNGQWHVARIMPLRPNYVAPAIL